MSVIGSSVNVVLADRAPVDVDAEEVEKADLRDFVP